MLRVALIGLGKMGLSHFAILKAHPDIELVAVCDNTAYMLAVLEKYTGVACYSDYAALLGEQTLDAVVIATPSRLHAQMVGMALECGLHVFCEKPFCLDVAEGERLAHLARDKGLANQVGYHYRFVAAFDEMKRLIDAGAIGTIHHLRAEAYGPVVLKPQGATWRTSRTEGGGCLYDYACHGIDLLNYLAGAPVSVGGTVLNRVFSREVDDEVYATLFYQDGKTAQIAANWSDDSVRKMTTKVTVWGSKGKMSADRQELQIFMRTGDRPDLQLHQGWNTRYITELAEPVWFYLRGEEYSAQIAHFVANIHASRKQHGVMSDRSTFLSAIEADRVVAMMQTDVLGGKAAAPASAARDKKTPRWWSSLPGLARF